VQYRILIPVGKPNLDGQAWKLPIDDPNVDYDGLEKRLAEKQAKRRQRTEKAAIASAEKRRKPEASTTDVPGQSGVGGTIDVPVGGTTDVLNQTQNPSTDPKNGSVTSTKKTKSAHNLMFEAICHAFGYDWQQITKSKRGQVNTAAKELIGGGAVPEDIPRLHNFCKRKFEHFGPVALATNWDDYKSEVSAKDAPPIPVLAPPTDDEADASLRKMGIIS
jgi:hypothetical protein